MTARASLTTPLAALFRSVAANQGRECLIGDRILRGIAAVTALAALTAIAAHATAGASAAFTDLQVGQTVNIEGRPGGPRVIVATEIEIKKRPGPAMLKGRIQAVDGKANTLTVLGVKVFAAPDTALTDREKRPIRFAGLQTGWKVRVSGKLRDDGTVQAAEIRVSKDPDEAEVESAVQAIDKARRTLTVMGFTVRVSPTTAIRFD